MRRVVQALSAGVVSHSGLLGVLVCALAAPPAFSMADCPADSAERIARAIDTLDAPVRGPQHADLAHRIATLDDPVLGCPGPSPVSALFRTFLRSRYGVATTASSTLPPLPEDPDLFERALVTLATLPPEQVAAGAAEGLGTGLVELTRARLHHDWLVPAAQGLSTADQRWLASWRPPADLPSAAHALVELVKAQPKRACFALTTGGGSLAHQVIQPIQDSLLAAILDESHERPAVIRAIAGIAVDSGQGGPAVATALVRVPSLDDTTDQAVARARDHIGRPGPWPDVQLPDPPPGRIRGLEALDTPTIARSDAVWTPSGLPHLSSAWLRVLLGLAAAAGAAGLGIGRPRLRAVAGPVLGLSVLALVDGLTITCGLAPPASDHPLFQFIAQSRVSLERTADGWTTGGGSMRLASISERPTPGVPRVVFLGASSVHGSHYVAEAAFPARISHHGPPIEALNFGIGGTTSAGVASAGRTALTLQPDALVVMYGHNEAAQFSRLALYRHTSSTALRTRLTLANSGLYRLLSSALATDRPAAAPADLYRSEDPTRDEVRDLSRLAVQHLRQQLGGLLTDAGRAGVPVVLVIPPTNLRFAHLQPFATPGPGDAADLNALRTAADEAAARGDGPAARAHLQAAIDRSASPRELVTPIRAALVELGDQHGVVTVDAAAWMSAHAPDGVTPSGFFWDDVHPTAEGHDALARLLAPVLQDVLAPQP